ncbi:hypothetical protein IT408_00260 [Candidatus Uhrbacteria bacterium]|nr:hypothetical protein [Candidatus Uhrbacteria bacterium]
MQSAKFYAPGSPNALCAICAEAIIDAYIERDKTSRVRIEVSGGFDALFITGMVKSTADIDVASVVRRQLGRFGAGLEIEPFVSIENVTSWLTEPMRHVIAYATNETPEYLPLASVYAKRIVSTLEAYRQTNERGFWMGPDFEGSVMLQKNKIPQIFLQVEQGSKNIDEVRSEVSSCISGIFHGAKVRTNDGGVVERRGLHAMLGSSAHQVPMYGTTGVAMTSMIGYDPHDPQKAGTWLARSVARELVKNGHEAVLIQLAYEPGRKDPFAIIAKNEKGERLEQQISIEQLHLDKVIQSWWRPGLNVAAYLDQRMGGEALPWEM